MLEIIGKPCFWFPYVIVLLSGCGKGTSATTSDKTPTTGPDGSGETAKLAAAVIHDISGLVHQHPWVIGGDVVDVVTDHEKDALYRYVEEKIRSGRSDDISALIICPGESGGRLWYEIVQEAFGNEYRRQHPGAGAGGKLVVAALEKVASNKRLERNARVSAAASLRSVAPALSRKVLEEEYAAFEFSWGAVPPMSDPMYLFSGSNPRFPGRKCAFGPFQRAKSPVLRPASQSKPAFFEQKRGFWAV